ncbi:hypothetical protein Tco_1213741 [Tanacetum coccineum]
MKDDGCKVECLNEVVKVSKSDEMSFDLGCSAEIVSYSGNDIDIETNSRSEQEVVFDCCGNQSQKMVDKKEREMVAMEVDIGPLRNFGIFSLLNMVNNKALLDTNWLRTNLSNHGIICRGSKSWGKPVHKKMQMGLTKRYLQRENPHRTLPWNNQRKRLSPESKEMLRRKVKEIEAYNASKICAAVKKKGEGSANTTKEKRARCYICRK